MFYLRGRIARSSSSGWNLTKTLIQLVLFWAFFLWFVPEVIHSLEKHYRFGAFDVGLAIKVSAFVIVFLGCWLGLSSAVLMAIEGKGTPMPTDSTQALVVKGAYRHVRNPMVIAGSLQFGGVGLWLGSGMTIFLLGMGILGWNFVIRPWEEWDMEARFGDAYHRYRQRVMCWRPRMKPYDPAKDDTEPALALARTTPRHDTVLLFDGHCMFCQKQAMRLKKLTGVIIVDFQVPLALWAFPGITYEACMRQLHLVDMDGHVSMGMEAVVHALKRKRWGKCAYLYYLPGIRYILDFWYGWVGANRYFIWGETESCDGACHLHTRRN